MRLSFQNILPTNIIQIGCGGTGSYLTPNLCRLLAHHKSLHNTNITYTLVDKDKVELKNVSRQNFISKDIGKPKAQVLCERYSGVFGLNMNYSEEFLTEKNFESIIPKYERNIIIGCVDNHATRKIIGTNYQPNYSLWIDSGNELENGQIFINGTYYDKNRNINIINMLDIYNNIKDNDGKDHPDALSCADRVSTGEQSIAVNIMASNMLLNVIDSLFRLNPLSYYQVTFGINNSTNKFFIDDYKNNLKNIVDKKK
jgi:PRTRC genetic system ThiF family protein